MAKILIVEDEKALNDAYELVLKQQGHDVKSAYDGQEALRIIKDYQPDLLLLDLRMPNMGGVELLERLNPAKEYPQLKIIVFTNYDDQKEIDKAFAHGAAHYVLKAWSSPANLIKVVNQALEA